VKLRDKQGTYGGGGFANETLVKSNIKAAKKSKREGLRKADKDVGKPNGERKPQRCLKR